METSFGPSDGTGRTWNEYLADEEEARRVRLRLSRMASSPDVTDVDYSDDEPIPAITRTVPAREVDSGWPSTINTWRNRLLANDWKVKVGFAEAHHEDLYYKNGSLRKPAHDEQMWWINAAKPGRYVTISYGYANGKNIMTARTIRGQQRLVSDAEMKDAVEAEDD
jgi:hypothetical protein